MLALLVPLGLCGCYDGRDGVARGREAPLHPHESERLAGGIAFSDATRDAGIDFVHCHGGSGAHYYIETMSGGCAFLDFDGDGWLDIFLVQSAPLPGFQPEPGRDLRDRLYRNNGDGSFTDVTDRSGLGDTRYGLGCCAADYDNDGDTDLFVTNLEGNVLYRNNGDGSFTDVTAASRIGGRSLCTSAAFVDYDHDGRLDLFICRYMDYDLETNPRCKDRLQRPAYCSPFVYEQTHSLLYRNNGDGSFTDVTAASRIGAARGRAVGVACADFNGDGRTDLFVTCDLSPNLLYLNNGDGTFREDGAGAGVGFGGNGSVMAGMGVDAADYDNDGQIDLVVTNFENEPISLYCNSAGGYFIDESVASRIGTLARPYLKWGVKFADLDLDGSLDLFVVNGHVDDRADEIANSLGYAQACRVYRNLGNRTFADVSNSAGTFFGRRQVARGAAVGDYDNDGDLDVLIGCNNQPAILLRNDSKTTSRWVRLALSGRGCNRDAIGARVQVRTEGCTQTRFVQSGTSYLADHDRRLLVGLGKAGRAWVSIDWPCGAHQEGEYDAGRTHVATELNCKLSRTETAQVPAKRGEDASR
jgi:hypothetical protein